MTILRSIYHLIVPTYVRKRLWTLYWFLVGLRRNYEPHSLFFTLDYEEYWDGRHNTRHGIEISYTELIDLCSKQTPYGARVLDFGCGAGVLLGELVRLRNIEPVGVDISKTALGYAQEKGIETHLIEVVNPTDLLPLGHFDVAFATEVAEHIVNSELVLVALGKVADKVIVSIPNTGFIDHRLRLLMGRFPRQWIYHPAEHLRFWTKADFVYSVNLIGFEVEKISGVHSSWLARRFPSLFAPSLLFTLKPTPRLQT